MPTTWCRVLLRLKSGEVNSEFESSMPFVEKFLFSSIEAYNQTIQKTVAWTLHAVNVDSYVSQSVFGLF